MKMTLYKVRHPKFKKTIVEFRKGEGWGSAEFGQIPYFCAFFKAAEDFKIHLNHALISDCDSSKQYLNLETAFI